jgi:hypothetical protein
MGNPIGGGFFFGDEAFAIAEIGLTTLARRLDWTTDHGFSVKR